MLFIPIQRGEGNRHPRWQGVRGTHGRQWDSAAGGLGGGLEDPGGSPCRGAGCHVRGDGAEGKEPCGKGLLAASCDYLAIAAGRARAGGGGDGAESRWRQGRARGSRGRGGPCGVPMETGRGAGASPRGASPSPSCPQLPPGLSRAAGSPGSFCSSRGTGMSQRRALHPSLPVPTMLLSTARASSRRFPPCPAAGAGLSLPPGCPLPVEPQMPVCMVLGGWGVERKEGGAGRPRRTARLPAALPRRSAAPARRAAVSAGEDPVSQRCLHAAAPTPAPAAAARPRCSCRGLGGTGRELLPAGEGFGAHPSPAIPSPPAERTLGCRGGSPVPRTEPWAAVYKYPPAAPSPLREETGARWQGRGRDRRSAQCRGRQLSRGWGFRCCRPWPASSSAPAAGSRDAARSWGCRSRSVGRKGWSRVRPVDKLGLEMRRPGFACFLPIPRAGCGLSCPRGRQRCFPAPPAACTAQPGRSSLALARGAGRMRAGVPRGAEASVPLGRGLPGPAVFFVASVGAGSRSSCRAPAGPALAGGVENGGGCAVTFAKRRWPRYLPARPCWGGSAPCVHPSRLVLG